MTNDPFDLDSIKFSGFAMLLAIISFPWQWVPQLIMCFVKKHFLLSAFNELLSKFTDWHWMNSSVLREGGRIPSLHLLRNMFYFIDLPWCHHLSSFKTNPPPLPSALSLLHREDPFFKKCACTVSQNKSMEWASSPSTILAILFWNFPTSAVSFLRWGDQNWTQPHTRTPWGHCGRGSASFKPFPNNKYQAWNLPFSSAAER